MKKIFEKAAYWLLPPGIEQLLRRRLPQYRSKSALDTQASLSPDIQTALSRNEVWRNCHVNDHRCFILGSGPSINTQDMTLLKDEICISVSNWYVHKDYDLIQPRYHCVPDVLGGHKDFLTEDYAVKWFSEMERRTGQAFLFLSCGDRVWVEREGLFKNRDIYYYFIGEHWENLEKTGIDLTRPLPAVLSVSVLALEIALFMGFKEIYLLGCDHTWTSDFGVTKHFYEERESILATRPGYSEWSGYDLGDQFHTSWLLWNQYKVLRNHFQARGTKIYNATAGGLLDVFPRVRFESLF